MKKLLFAVAIVSFCAFSVTETKAAAPERFTKQAPDTCTNQDTVTILFNAIPSKVRSFQATVTRLTGTLSTSSLVILQGTLDGTNWQAIDTMTMTNTASQYKIWKISETSYYSYRIRYITPSSTQTSVVSFMYVRRPDD